jgi:hypothetical protein
LRWRADDVARYELMDLVSGNFAGVYETEEEALRDVAATVRRFGPDALEGVALGFDDFPGGTGRVIADGAELVRLALAACPLDAPACPAPSPSIANGAASARPKAKARKR